MSHYHIIHRHCEPRFNLGKYILSTLASCLAPWSGGFYPSCGCSSGYIPYNSIFGQPPTYDYTLRTSPFKYTDRFYTVDTRNNLSNINTYEYNNSTTTTDNNNNVGLDTFVSKTAYYNNQPNNYLIPTINYSSTFMSTKSDSSGSKKIPKTTTGNIDNSYRKFTTTASAEEHAKKDSRLESLKIGGTGWSIATESFITDIPYAKKGTGNILTKVAKILKQNLVITSALGTGAPNNPHEKDGYKSHHNATNPKLDIRVPANMTAKEFAQKLDNTGYFSHVLPEGDHVDVQIDINKFETA